jgi:hypothetical protein
LLVLLDRAGAPVAMSDTQGPSMRVLVPVFDLPVMDVVVLEQQERAQQSQRLHEARRGTCG